MSLPTSLKAYEDCRQLYEAASQDPKGARACLGPYEACVNMRTRMHYYRKLEREANAQVYPKGDPNWGTSVYDEYVIQIIPDEDGNHWLYVQPRSAKILAIEGLSEVPELINIDGYEIKSIEDKSDATS